MRIAAFSKFKSIPAFEPIELPQLTVITGVNGSGKSQLLAGLQMQDIRCDLFGPMTPERVLGPIPSAHPEITLLKSHKGSDEQFVLELPSLLGGRFGSDNQTLRPRSQMYQFEVFRSAMLAPFRLQLEAVLGCSLLDLLIEQEDARQLGSEVLAIRAGLLEGDPRRSQVEDIFQSAEVALEDYGGRPDPTRAAFCSNVKTASDEFRVNKLLVTEEMIKHLFNRVSFQMFQPNIVEVFRNYRDNVVGNQMDEIEARDDPKTQFLTSEQIAEKYGPPPWTAITELLVAMGLPFEVVPQRGKMAQPVRFRLRMVGGVEELTFEDLSSGEQVLLRFAVSLMQPNPTMYGLQRPKLLLLDEMDASLHPEMVQRWLGAIEQGIVGELGIHVILTTHSPSTVALAPEASIFLMDRGVLRKEFKQAALNKLTRGVPTLSIDYSGRRQVFCESDTDAAIFEAIYSSIKSRLSLSKELNFIGTGIRDKAKPTMSGEGLEINAGGAVVSKIVDSLSGYHVESVYGLIDWDQKAMSSERVRVIGEGTYYTIENIILNPLLVGALFVIDRVNIEGLPFIARDLHTLDDKGWQKLADFVQDSLVLADDEITLIDLKSISGLCIKARQSLARTKGHVLEEMLITKFPALKKYRSKPSGVKRAISEIVIGEYPELCPQSISEAFLYISNFQSS